MSSAGYESVCAEVSTNWQTARRIRVAHDTSLGSLKDSKSAEYAGSFSYLVDEHVYPTVRNRFFIWHSRGNELLLEEHSFDHHLQGAVLLLEFPSAVLPGGVALFSGVGRSIVLLVATISSVHRFSLPHPRTIHESTQNSHTSILATFTESQLKPPSSQSLDLSTNGSAALLSAVEWDGAGALFAVAFASQTLLFVRLPTDVNEPPTQVQLQCQSIGNRLRSSIPFLRADETMEELVDVFFCRLPRSNGPAGGRQSVLCALSRDLVLRVWSTETLEQISATYLLTVLNVTPELTTSCTEATKLKAKCSQFSDTIVITVAISYNGSTLFLLLAPIGGGAQMAKIMEITAPDSQHLSLIDFSLNRDYLWTLWRDNNGETGIFGKAVSVAEQVHGDCWERFDEDDSQFGRSAVKASDQGALLSSLFDTRVFPYHVVFKSVCLCLNKDLTAPKGEDWQFLKKILLEATKAAESDTQKSARNASIVKSVWSSCLQYYKAGSRPISLLCCPEIELFGTIRLDRFTAFIRDDTIADELDCWSVADELFGDETILELGRLLEQQDRKWDQIRQTVMDTLVLKGKEGVVDSLANSFQNFGCIETIVRSFDTLPLSSDQLENAGEASWLLQSRLGIGMLTNAVEKQINRRQHIIRRLLLLSACLPRLNQAAQGVLDGDDISIVDKLRQLLRLHSVLLTSCRLVVPQSNQGATCLLSQFVGRRQWGGRLCWLIEERLQDASLPQIWGTALPLLITAVVGALMPTAPALALPRFLYELKQYSVLIDLCDFLLPISEHLRHVLLHYKACSLANIGQLEQAFSVFQMAAQGVYAPESMLVTSLKLKADSSTSPADAFANYCLKVITVFDELDAGEYVVRVTEEVLRGVAQPSSTNAATLWTILFKEQLSQGLYENALSTIIGNKNAESRNNCLRQLLVTLVDRRNCHQLVSLDYGCLETEALHILVSRARASDVGRSASSGKGSPDYYALLHAFHIRRRNFKRAATLMYEQAMRVQHEGDCGLSVTEQMVQSLETCVLCLAQASSDQQWIAIPTKSQATDENDVSAMEQTTGVPVATTTKIDIVTLDDIHKQLAIQQARLTLMVAEQDCEQTPPTSNPNQLVASLLRFDHYDAALKLSRHFDLRTEQPGGLIDRLTWRCINSESVNLYGRSEPSSSWIQHNKLLLVGQSASVSGHGLSTSSQRCWMILQAYLNELSQADKSACYHRAAARRMLSSDRPFPGWFIEQYKKVDFSDYIRVLIEYEQLSEAIAAVGEYVDVEITNHGGTKKDCWIPISSIDLLYELVNSSENYRKELWDPMHNLTYKLEKYFKWIETMHEVTCAS